MRKLLQVAHLSTDFRIKFRHERKRGLEIHWTNHPAGEGCAMTDFQRDRIIRMAWEDRTTFEEIERETGFTESEVIKVMRKTLRARSFRLWRKRVTGRVTKHRKLMHSREVGIARRTARHGDDFVTE